MHSVHDKYVYTFPWVLYSYFIAEVTKVLIWLIKLSECFGLASLTDSRAPRSRLWPKPGGCLLYNPSMTNEHNVVYKGTIEYWGSVLLQGALGTLKSRANHLWWSRGPAAETGSCRWGLGSGCGCWHPGESASSPWSPAASPRLQVFGKRRGRKMSRSKRVPSAPPK